jgi:hypothetical protein
VSHTTRGELGTIFHHNGGYDGDTEIVPVSYPERHDEPDGSIWFSVDVPFGDLRQLVSGYLRLRWIERLEDRTGTREEITRVEALTDDELEAELLGGVLLR